MRGNTERLVTDKSSAPALHVVFSLRHLITHRSKPARAQKSLASANATNNSHFRNGARGQDVNLLRQFFMRHVITAHWFKIAIAPFPWRTSLEAGKEETTF